MHDYSIIKDIVLILLVSLPIIIIFNRIQLPSIVGFLIAGIILGPSVLKIISNPEQIEVMAEIGVILLLFSVGLEVSLKELLDIKKIVLIGGGLQVIANNFIVINYYLCNWNTSKAGNIFWNAYQSVKHSNCAQAFVR